MLKYLLYLRHRNPREVCLLRFMGEGHIHWCRAPRGHGGNCWNGEIKEEVENAGSWSAGQVGQTVPGVV